ncbi:sulfotransferase domain-containing protein [soil metagenome]
MSRFGLLASYPRSGNTWVRAVLSALVRGNGQLDINALEGAIASDRSLVDDALEIETSDLLPDEERRLRPDAFRHWLPARARTFPLKTHDAWLPAAGATQPPFPREKIAAVVLIVRDPRDVVVSFAHYYGLTIAEAIETVGHPRFSLGTSTTGLRPQVSQLVSSWSRHTASWRDSSLPLTLIRYEDLLAVPLESFASIARAFEYPTAPDLLTRAIDAARLDGLRAAEALTGFRESSRFAPNRFFGAGTAGGWRTTLTAAQASRIVDDHGIVMRDMRYHD